MTEPKRPGAITTSEIESQPRTWQQAIDLQATGTALPGIEEPVIFLGCGTSYYIGVAYAALRRQAGAALTVPAIPSELPDLPRDATVIALSRSGTTGDVIDMARNLKDRHKIVAVMGDLDTPLAEVANEVVDLSFADETSIVQTRFASTAFTVLRASVTTEAVGTLPTQAQVALTRPLPPVSSHVVYLGSGPSLGLAHEASLKCLEASGRWSEAYAVREYQHGPLAAAREDTVVWPLVPIAVDIRAAIEDTGAHVVKPSLDPQAELVAAHRYAVAMALDEGRDPDVPHHLSRSVTDGL